MRPTSLQRAIRRVAKRLFLLALGFGLALILGEILIRLVAPQPLSGFWTIDTATGLRANKSSGRARHQFGERVVHYSFFPPHLRDTPVEDGAIHILMLGDSFTFGWLLDREDTYVRHLQQLADAEFGTGVFQFLNGAAGGWGTADYVAFVEEFGDLIRPNAVLVFINTDDIGRSLTSRLYEFAGSGTPELIRRPLAVSRLKRMVKRMPGYQSLLEHSHLAQFVRLSVATWYRPASSRGVAGLARKGGIPAPGSEVADGPAAPVLLGNALFLRLHGWCAARGISLYVTTTGRHDPAPQGPMQEPTRVFMAQAEEFFQGARIPYCDISPAFFALTEQERLTHSIENDGHPSARGSRFIAEQVWREFLLVQLTNYLEAMRHGTSVPAGGVAESEQVPPPPLGELPGASQLTR